VTKSLLKNDSANLQKSPILLGFRAAFFNFLLATHLVTGEPQFTSLLGDSAPGTPAHAA
jgi:hypothetical protein